MVDAVRELMGCLPSTHRTGTASFASDEGCVSTEVRHVRQSFAWDCGLACVQMILRGRGVRCSLGDLMRVCGTQSVWTVDLAYILSKYSVDFTFYTINDGVRPEYGDEAFYKADLDEDMLRVNKLFQAAPSLGIAIVKGSITMEEITSTVEQGGVVVVLVDKRLLPSGSTIARMIQNRLSMGFIGHYVIVCGFKKLAGTLLLADPASHDERVVVEAADLEAARKSFGTDEDCIIVRPARPASDADVMSPLHTDAPPVGQRIRKM